jgi:hypothetical protein
VRRVGKRFQSRFVRRFWQFRLAPAEQG